jgi:phospholipid/cholesterol/gamma-HCH transport system substrate-binding protein
MMRRRLSNAWDHLRSTPGLGRDVLAVTVVLGFCTAFGLVYLSRQNVIWPWDDRYTIYAEFAEAAAVSPGNGQEVRVAGVPVGQIVAASVTPEGFARLELSIDADDIDTFYEDATMVMRPKNPLNDMYIEVQPGGPPARPVEDGGTIRATSTASPVQVDAVLQHLEDGERRALGALLAEADVAMARASETLPQGLTAVDGTLQDLQPVVVALRDRRDAIRELVSTLGAVASAVGEDDARLAALVTDAAETLGVLEAQNANLDTTLAELPGLTAALDGSMTSVGGLVGELNPLLDSIEGATDELTTAFERLSPTVDRLGATVERARPVIVAAGPLLRDLRPFTTGALSALDDLAAITPRLDPLTAAVVGYLPDLQAFVYNTASVTGTEDANGPILRGLLQMSIESTPLDNPLDD